MCRISSYVVLVRGSTEQGLNSCSSIVGISARYLSSCLSLNSRLNLRSNSSLNSSRGIEFI